MNGASPTAIAVFLVFVGAVLGLSFWLGRKAKSAHGYFAAHGQIPWFVNGVAFAGDYLSAASFLGICGMIAFAGYDGFLYSIGYLAGWIVALFVVAEPLKRLGRFTFADALDQRFGSRGIKLTAAISTLVVSVFYLIPQMVGAGSLIKPLLGLPHVWGVVIVGATVTAIVATAGMVSTTWVQFIKGALLVVFCLFLTVLLLMRGLTTKPDGRDMALRSTPQQAVAAGEVLAAEGAWAGKPFVRVRLGDGGIAYWREGKDGQLLSARAITLRPDGTQLLDGRPVAGGAAVRLPGYGHIDRLPDGAESTGPLGPLAFVATIQRSDVVVWRKQELRESDGALTTVHYPEVTPGADLLVPGGSATFSGAARRMPAVDPAKPETTAAWWKALWTKVDFVSLMLALFCGTASLPHILIRYYTVKDEASARKSTVVGIATIGFFYVLTLYLGLGAMTSGRLDLTDTNMSAPLLARAFGELLFAVISAIAFTTILGTVSGLIMAASGAIVHDLATNLAKIRMDDGAKVRAGKIAAICVGVVAMWLGIRFRELNASFLVGWAFNIAASANLPALIMLLFWRGTTKQGITWAILVGMLTSLGWVLCSKEAFQYVYGYTGAEAASLAPVRFSQPGIVTIPLGFVVLIVVSLLTRRRGGAAAGSAQQAQAPQPTTAA